MITNATLIRVDVPGVPDVAGTIAYTAGSGISVGCCMDEPTSSQKYMLGAKIKDATASLYVPAASLAAAGLAGEVPIREGYRVRAALEGQSAGTYEVVYVRDRVKGSLSHLEIFLRLLA